MSELIEFSISKRGRKSILNERAKREYENKDDSFLGNRSDEISLKT